MKSNRLNIALVGLISMISVGCTTHSTEYVVTDDCGNVVEKGSCQKVKNVRTQPVRPTISNANSADIANPLALNIRQTACSIKNNHNICQQKELFENNCEVVKKCDNYLPKYSKIKISVVGQGVAPCKGTCSPAQSLALAKRAAIADSYRLIAEKVKGVYVEGEDLIENMMVKRTRVRTAVAATIRNANIVETTYKDGLCEVEMEIVLSYYTLVK